MAKNISRRERNDLIFLTATQILLALFIRENNRILKPASWSEIQEELGCSNLSNTYGFEHIPQAPAKKVSSRVFQEAIKLLKVDGKIYDITRPHHIMEQNDEGVFCRVRGLSLTKVRPMRDVLSGYEKAASLYEQCVIRRS